MLLNKVIINILRVWPALRKQMAFRLNDSSQNQKKFDHAVLFKRKHIKSTLNRRLNLQKWDIFKDLVNISKSESSLAVPVGFHFASPVKKTTCRVDYCLINLKPTSIIFSSKHVCFISANFFLPKCCCQKADIVLFPPHLSSKASWNFPSVLAFFSVVESSSLTLSRWSWKLWNFLL